jgi:hypothetical protein
MRMRRIVGSALVAGFVALVVHASAANQCPASQLGACARLHEQFMRPVPAAPLALVAAPMRGVSDRG